MQKIEHIAKYLFLAMAGPPKDRGARGNFPAFSPRLDRGPVVTDWPGRAKLKVDQSLLVYLLVNSYFMWSLTPLGLVDLSHGDERLVQVERVGRW